MRMNQKKKVSKKIAYISSIVAVLVVGLLVLYYIFIQQSPVTVTPNSDTASNNDGSMQTDSSNQGTKDGSNPSNIQASEDVPASTTGAISITKLDQGDGFVNARAETSNFSPTQCVYTFSSDGSKPVVRDQKGKCSEISIPQDEFDKIGTYTLTVSVYSNNEKLTATKDIYVQ